MKHIEIDEIYKYKLGLFESERETEIRNHINNCELCREKLDSIENEINILSSFNPPLVKAHNPLKIEKSNLIWLKRAAVILILYIQNKSLLPDKSSFLKTHQLIHLNYLTVTMLIYIPIFDFQIISYINS